MYMQLAFGISKLDYIWRMLMSIFATSYLKAHEVESPIKKEAPPTNKTKETKKK